MTPRHTATRQHRVRHARRQRRHPLLSGVALVALALVSFVGTGMATAIIRLSNNIETHDVDELIDVVAPRPNVTTQHSPEDAYEGRALNFLIMGSDTREGVNGEIGGENEGMRSDTTIVAHISADRNRVELVSIPRDSRVDVPACSYLDGTTSRPQSARFNAAFSIGAEHGDVGEAAACTVNTVQSLTGVSIDGWIVVDFAGFRNMVEAIGGVDICIPNDMSSEKAGLYLTAGMHTLDGSTALAFARARTGEGLGNGSDINRLGRQQQLMSAIAHEVFEKNLLTDIDQLYRFLTAATQSLTADDRLGSVRTLAGLGWSLRSIPPQNITFMTIPHRTNPADRNEVVWSDEAALVWTNMANDVPMVGQATAPPTTDPAAPADPSAPADPNAPAVPTEPTEAPTPGIDPFTPADLPAVCG